MTSISVDLKAPIFIGAYVIFGFTFVSLAVLDSHARKVEQNAQEMARVCLSTDVPIGDCYTSCVAQFRGDGLQACLRALM